MHPFRRFATLIEDVLTGLSAENRDYIEALAAEAETDLGREWMRSWLSKFIRELDNNLSPRQAERTSGLVRRALKIIDKNQPQNAENLDLPDIWKLGAVDVVQALLPIAANDKVRNWISVAIPKHINKIGAVELFRGKHDWRETYRTCVRYLNQHPPGRADVPVDDVLAVMEEPDHTHALGTGTDSPAFKAWFGHSAVVDRLGHPLVVFRGTTRPDAPTGFLTRKTLPSFSASPDVASVYASKTSGYQTGAMVGAYYLSIQNPVDLRGHVTISLDTLLSVMGIEDLMTELASMRYFGAMLAELEAAKDNDEGFLAELPKGLYGEMHFHEYQREIRRALMHDDSEAFYQLLDDTRFDAYAIADTNSFYKWAESLGFDGIIYDDVFGGQAIKVAVDLLGKASQEIRGLKDDGEVSTHVTYRPFHQSQIKSVFNRGSWNSSKHVSEGRGKRLGGYSADEAKEIGDCAITAISLVTGQTWDDVFEQAKGMFGTYGMNSGAIHRTMRALGWNMESYFKMPWFKESGMTVQDAELWLQKNAPDIRLLCQINVRRVPHAIAFVDGKFHNVQGATRAKLHLVDICTRTSKHVSEGRSVKTKQILNHLPHMVLPAGTMLYHGTNAKDAFDIPRGPAWFSLDKAIAAKWAGWSGSSEGRNRVLSFRTIQDIEFLDWRRRHFTYEDYTELSMTLVDEYEASPYQIANALRGRENGWYADDEVMLIDPRKYLERVRRSKH